jgi:protein tyrosine/serine phosphatase
VTDKTLITKTGFKQKTGLLIAAGVIVLAAAGVLAYKSVCYNFIPKRFGVVEQGSIYRSGQISAPLVKNILTKHNIRVIVNLTGNDPNDPDQQAEKKAAAELNITVLRFPLGGKGTGDVNSYANAVAAIANAQKNNLPVLVHCAAGAQRTGGVIAVYQLLVEKKDPAFVISEMKHYGWNPKDNPALVPYLNSNMAELAIKLKQAGVITETPNPTPSLKIEE